MDFGANISTNLSLDLESVSLRYNVLGAQTTLNFRDQIWQKMDFGSEFQKSNSGFGINISTIWCVSIFSQNGQCLVFRPKFGEISHYVRYFGPNIVEGVAENCVEVDGAEWRWVNSLVIPFGDILKNLSLVVSYTPVMLHSQWH